MRVCEYRVLVLGARRVTSLVQVLALLFYNHTPSTVPDSTGTVCMVYGVKCEPERRKSISHTLYR